MDQLTGRFMEFIQRNKYVLPVILLGLVLMLLPGKNTQTTEDVSMPQSESMDMGKQLEDILAQIDGVGRIRVFLSVAEGERTVYVRNEESLSAADRIDVRSETVIISDSQRGESGLILQVIAPVYQGAIIVCQGGDSSAVRLAVVEAVCDATGLTSDKVAVLKMK